jgi:glycosyltransferase involved in cell wall biosynthesis
MKLLICTQAVDKNHSILGFFCGWITEFAKNFDEVHVICLQKGAYNLPSNVHVYSLGKEEGKSKLVQLYRFYKVFSKIFISSQVDYVFFHMGALFNIMALPFFLIRKLYGTQFYWWKAHGHINAMGKLALRFVDRVYTSTESGFAIDTPKRHIVGQAIDVSHFVFPESEIGRKKEIIFVGRIMPVKRIEDFLDTAYILSSQDASLLFRVIGPVGDEAYFAKIKQKCAELNLQNKVHFVGSKTQIELVDIYQKAAFFLNTSVTHSMDKTVLEAALCGCIPVTGNKAFVDLLQEDGLYKERATGEDYASMITKLLASPKTDMQNILRQHVIAQHSLDTFSNRIFTV